jgi:hypothetical protein
MNYKENLGIFEFLDEKSFNLVSEAYFFNQTVTHIILNKSENKAFVLGTNGYLGIYDITNKN